MSDTSLPTDLTYGFVTARILLAVGDGPDPGRMPDGRPAIGKVKFTRVGPVSKTTSPSAFVLHQPVTCNLDSEGVLVEAP